MRREADAPVTVVLLDGAGRPRSLPASRCAASAPAIWTTPRLLDLIFEADHVITW